MTGEPSGSGPTGGPARAGLAARLALTLTGLLALRGILPPAEWPWLPIPWLAALAVLASLLAAFRLRREPAGAPLRRDPAVLVLLACLGLLLAVLLSHRMRITSDGIDHYVYLRSLWFDRDLELANDYDAVAPGLSRVDPVTPIGRTSNHHPVGPALVWSPLFLVADALARLTGRSGDTALHRNAVAIASLLYGWAGLLLVYLAARRRTGRAAALLGTLALGFGTFLYWYLAFAPTMAHAPAFGAAALVVWLWLSPMPAGPRRAALLGAACGLAALLRWANGLILLLPLCELLPRLLRPGERRAALRDLAILGGVSLAVFSPQLLAWNALYGSPFTIPQGEAFVGNAPAWDGVLFSPRKGLFSWSPLLYVGLAGLVPFALRERWRALSALVFALLLVRVNAGVADWWGGAAFGGRRFDALLPLFGLGLAFAVAGLAELSRRRPLLLPALVLCAGVGWNVLLARQWRAGAFDTAEPVAFEQMGRGVVAEIDRAIGSPFSLPAALVEWWRSGRPPADYESAYTTRPFARWSIRMGADERLFLDDGWGVPLAEDGASFRCLEGRAAGLVIPLHQAAASRLGLRLRAEAGARVQPVVNGRPVAEWDVGPAWADLEAAVPEALLRPGRNELRLRLLESEARLCVAGAWLERTR
ncbi:MAG: hypothetical protein AB7O37_06740 [Vicinamibacteria bacterium]